MPDETPHGPPWWRNGTEFVKVIKELVILVGSIAAVTGAIQAGCNGQKSDRNAKEIQYVATKQNEQLQAAVVIKDDLKTAAEKTEKKLDSIREKTNAVESRVKVIDDKIPRKN